MEGFKSSPMFSRYMSMVASGAIEYNECQVTALRDICKYDRQPKKWWRLGRSSALPKRGVYLHGEVGRGKSLISRIFYDNSSIGKKKKVHFNVFMRTIHGQLHKIRQSKDQQQDQLVPAMREYIEDVELIYLDEVQVRDVCEAVIMHRVLSVLFSRSIVVLMTSNYAPRKLYENGIQRELFEPAIDAIEKHMEVIPLVGERDYRAMKGSSKSCRYYTGRDADKQLMRHFEDLLGGREAEEVVFNVDNRDVRMGKSCGDMAWFKFSDLCGNKHPLWVADYQKIAKSFTHIFIEGIPVFNSYTQNEMQRFIVLIDELYEHKNLLSCSIADSIDNIHEGPAAVDFQRAASRLKEMGAEYGQVSSSGRR